jgi:glutamate transport system substrate-binding protein
MLSGSQFCRTRDSFERISPISSRKSARTTGRPTRSPEVTQTGADSASFLAHETFTNVPDKYRQYFKDIDHTGTMARRGGARKLCTLAADFVEP